jgi:hypothetical protein
VDQASRVFVNGGVGNDWGVFRVFDNAQTGLQPVEAQGASFALRQDLGPAQIRITGYGVDTGEDNQVQQTHVGPNAGSSGTTMRYQTDTTGGNSGSPVIDEATDVAVGVHTHGGCTTAGTGNNSGTSTFNTAFWAALDFSLPAWSVTANPPTVTTSSPGSFQITYQVCNNSGASASGDVFYTAGSFTGVIQSGTLADGQCTPNLNYTQTVPSGISAGTYPYTVRVGQFPGVTVASDVVQVTVAAPREGAPAGEPAATWAVVDADTWAVAPAPQAAGTEPLSAYALTGNAPNPFTGATTIRYTLPEAQTVRLAVYDLLGREVALLVDGYQEAGQHAAGFDASALGAGVYVYRLQAGTFSATRRMTVIE